MTMITPSYLGETIEYSSLHACRSTLEDPTVTTGKDHWHVLLRARAVENQAFVLAPAQTGKHPKGRQTYGKSLIVDPWGDVLAQCGEGEGFALARLDFAYQDKVRTALPCLAHRKI